MKGPGPVQDSELHKLMMHAQQSMQMGGVVEDRDMLSKRLGRLKLRTSGRDDAILVLPHGDRFVVLVGDPRNPYRSWRSVELSKDELNKLDIKAGGGDDKIFIHEEVRAGGMRIFLEGGDDELYNAGHIGTVRGEGGDDRITNYDTGAIAKSKDHKGANQYVNYGSIRKMKDDSANSHMYNAGAVNKYKGNGEIYNDQDGWFGKIKGTKKGVTVEDHGRVKRRKGRYKRGEVEANPVQTPSMPAGAFPGQMNIESYPGVQFLLALLASRGMGPKAGVSYNSSFSGLPQLNPGFFQASTAVDWGFDPRHHLARQTQFNLGQPFG